MLWIILSLLSSPPFTRADSLHLPPEMKQKYDEAGAAMAQGYRAAQTKIRQAEGNSSLVHSIVSDFSKIWAGAKSKGRGALVYFDHQLHEHVLGEERPSK